MSNSMPFSIFLQSSWLVSVLHIKNTAILMSDLPTQRLSCAMLRRSTPSHPPHRHVAPIGYKYADVVRVLSSVSKGGAIVFRWHVTFGEVDRRHRVQ